MNKKSLLILAAAPLLLAGCGKISSVTVFKDYDPNSAVSLEQFRADLKAKQEEYLERIDEEKAPGVSFVGKSIEKERRESTGVTLGDFKVKNRYDSEMASEMLFDGQNKVYVKNYADSSEDDDESEGYKMSQETKTSEVYQTGTYKDEPCVFHIDENQKTYNTAWQDTVHEVAFDDILNLAEDCTIYGTATRSDLTKYYEKDGLFTVIFNKTLADYKDGELDKEDNYVKRNTTYECQFIFEGDKFTYYEYRLIENETGVNKYSKQTIDKSERGRAISIEIKSVSNKAVDLAKYVFNED